MTRDEMMTKLNEKANALMDDFTIEGMREIDRECGDWNSENEDEEIFFAEDYDENGMVSLFMIEDDVYYITEDMLY